MLHLYEGSLAEEESHVVSSDVVKRDESHGQDVPYHALHDGHIQEVTGIAKEEQRHVTPGQDGIAAKVLPRLSILSWYIWELKLLPSPLYVVLIQAHHKPNQATDVQGKCCRLVVLRVDLKHILTMYSDVQIDVVKRLCGLKLS